MTSVAVKKKKPGANLSHHNTFYLVNNQGFVDFKLCAMLLPVLCHCSLRMLGAVKMCETSDGVGSAIGRGWESRISC